MADYSAVRDAGLTLRALLRAHITNSGEPGLNGVDVDLGSPRELELANTTDVVSLWAYQVVVQPDLANRPAPRVADDLHAHRPVPVELAFLVTPLHDDGPTRLLLAGRVLQVLSDHRRLAGSDLVGSLAGTSTELHLGVEPMSAYELSSLWGALHTHQRLAVLVRMQGITIDSHRPPTLTSPVLQRDATVSQILTVTP